MKTYTFPVAIERDEDGFYATCPALRGCSTQGDTYEEALANIKDAIQAYLEDMEASNEVIPTPGPSDLLMVEVSI